MESNRYPDGQAVFYFVHCGHCRFFNIDVSQAVSAFCLRKIGMNCIFLAQLYATSALPAKKILVHFIGHKLQPRAQEFFRIFVGTKCSCIGNILIPSSPTAKSNTAECVSRFWVFYTMKISSHSKNVWKKNCSICHKTSRKCMDPFSLDLKICLEKKIDLSVAEGSFHTHLS